MIFTAKQVKKLQIPEKDDIIKMVLDKLSNINKLDEFEYNIHTIHYFTKSGLSDYKLIFSENNKDEIVYIGFKNNNMDIFKYPSNFKFNSEKSPFLKWLSFALSNVKITSTTECNIEHVEQNLTKEELEYRFP